MTPYYESAHARLYHGDCLEVLDGLEAGSMQTCVTSPPYFGLRDYGTAQWEGGAADCDHARPERRQNMDNLGERLGCGGGKKVSAADCFDTYRTRCGKCGARRIDQQIGLEQTPEDYVARMVEVFRKVWRVLADTGTLWLNLGDSFANDTKWGGTSGSKNYTSAAGGCQGQRMRRSTGLKPKDLIGVPWRVAFALQADGWTLRSDIVWAKPNPMPESVTDRPTKSHEYIFLLAKQGKYFYDGEAIKETGAGSRAKSYPLTKAYRDAIYHRNGLSGSTLGSAQASRNRRSVWTVASKPYKNAHFATFPPRLIEPCILAGCPTGGIVLDPFAGTATAGMVAIQHGRKFVGIDLNAKYLDLAQRRLSGVQMGLPFTSDEEE